MYIRNFLANQDTVDGKYQDARLKKTAAYYEYLMILFVLIVIVGLTFHAKIKT
tara:strand:- start:325 stop:483 length:159 start_codon:yes stop_codon:yes gene_type:complete